METIDESNNYIQTKYLNRVEESFTARLFGSLLWLLALTVLVVFGQLLGDLFFGLTKLAILEPLELLFDPLAKSSGAIVVFVLKTINLALKVDKLADTTASHLFIQNKN